MGEKVPDIIGKSFQFKNDEEKLKKGIVQQSFGLHGGKSFIFYGVIDGTDERLIVKYPRSGEDVTEEFDILDRIRKTSEKEYVPGCWAIKIDKTPALAMELMPKSRQWQTLKIEQKITPVEIIKGLRQGIYLLDCAHKEGIINTDIKIENCFWFEGERFVLLDWNKFKKFPKFITGEKKEQFENLKRQNYLVLFNFAYYMLVGEDPLNPLPDLKSPEPQKWSCCPFTIRRLMIELRKKGNPLSFKELDLALGDLQRLLELKEKKNWNAILQEAESILQPGSLSISTTNEMENVISIVSGNLPEEYKTRFAQIKQRMQDQITEYAQVLSGTEEEVLQMIAERRAEAALKTGEDALQKIPVTNNKKWNLSKIVSLSRVVYELVDESEYIAPSDAELIAASYKNPSGAKGISNSRVQKKINELYQLFDESDSWISEMNALVAESYEKKIEKVNEFESWFKDLSGKKIFHKSTLVILRSLIPDWDTGILKNAIEVKGRVERRLGMVQDFERSIENILIKCNGFSSDTIDSLDDVLKNASEDVINEPVYSIINTLQEFIKEQDWINALQTIKEKKNILNEELCRLYKRSLYSQINQWLVDISSRVKYKKDLFMLQLLSKIIDASEQNDAFLKIDQSMLRVLDIYNSADRNDENSLRECKKENIEPWMDSPADEVLSVDLFQRLLHLKEYQSDIEKAHESFISEIKSSQASIKELKEKAETEKDQVVELKRDLDEFNQIVNTSDEEIGKLSKDRKRKIHRLFQSINKEFPSDLHEKPEWWELLMEGSILTLERNIKDYQLSSVDREQVSLKEWETRIQLVKDLSDFQMLLQSYKKVPDYLQEKEALFKILIPGVIWEAARAYMKENNNHH